MKIRIATLEDKTTILKIAHQYSQELGYLQPIGLMKRIGLKTVFVAIESDKIVGFVDFHSPKVGVNKGYNVIYHIAVDKSNICNGIGRALVYSVPAPIRLKCTVDNAANSFYSTIGMSKVGTDNGRKRELNIWEMQLLHILIRGGNKSVPKIAKITGWAYGSRHDNSIMDWPYMIDINYQSYNWNKYLSIIEKWNPIAVMVADYEYPEQRELMLAQVEDLRRLGILRILVCPKFDTAIDDIPSDCIVAISVPTKSKGKYKGYLPPLEKLKGRKVHLLGGSPQKQAEIIKTIHFFEGLVISQDSNSHMDARRVSSVFASGTWKSLGYEKYTIDERAVFSGGNIRHWLNAACLHKQAVMNFS